MPFYIGIDTSNYTTSAAAYNNETGKYISYKKGLEVSKGKKGLSQSEALFLHTKNLPDLIHALYSDINPKQIAGIGVSSIPRRVEGSYMPCFLAGISAASAIAETAGVKLKRFSHQEGHIGAALLSADRLDLLFHAFYAVHVSGGTTEILHVVPKNGCFDTTLLASKYDISAGQLIDRTGVMLNLSFPAGQELDILSQKGKPAHVKINVKNGQANFSGYENMAKKMWEAGSSKEDVARFCIDAVGDTLNGLLNFAIPQNDSSPIVFMGGVMASSVLRDRFNKDNRSVFALPELATDNAAGIAVLSYLF